MSDNIISEKQQYPNLNPGESRADYIDPNKRNCIIAVPKYHENLFDKLKTRHDWLAETQGDPRSGGKHWNKRVKTPEDLAILNQLISDLRTEKSELFIDNTFHRKPKQLPIREYINEFLRVKGVFNYYTFITWYRVTVYPESGIDPEECAALERKEYLIIPLYIRLKKNKVYDQFKSIHYLNPSGTEYDVRKVNPLHFLRDDDPDSREQHEKDNDRYENKFNSKLMDD